MDTSAQTWAPLLVGLAGVGFWAWCLVDFTRTDEREMRTFPRQVWIVLLVLGSVIGSLMWFSLGRPQRRPPR